MENENRDRNNESVFSRKIRAGRRRTYFFDVRTTRGNDFYLTITESKKRFDSDGYERHKVFLYKEDFNKFIEEVTLTIDHIKTLMPDYDFDAFSHKYDEQTPYERKENTEVENTETETSMTVEHEEPENDSHTEDASQNETDTTTNSSSINPIHSEDDDDLKL